MKVIDLQYTLAVFSQEQIQSGSKYWKFCKKPYEPDSRFGWKKQLLAIMK
jgi:hypothetical protein